MHNDSEFYVRTVCENLKQREDMVPVKYIKTPDGEENPICYKYGKQLRIRVENIVFRNGKILARKLDHKKYGTDYDLPGGGVNSARTFPAQAHKETQEEALVNSTKPIYTGIKYMVNFKGNYPTWHIKKLHPYGIKYEGSITFVYVSDYISDFEGKIREIDKDDFYKTAKWYNPSELKLRKEHLDAVRFYVAEKSKEQHSKAVMVLDKLQLAPYKTIQAMVKNQDSALVYRHAIDNGNITIAYIDLVKDGNSGDEVSIIYAIDPEMKDKEEKLINMLMSNAKESAKELKYKILENKTKRIK